MTNGGQRPDPSGFRIENEMDLLFGRAHPNPTREGCPPPELLKRLARRELPIDDPAYDHFAKCSPCYQELRALQQADAATRRDREATTHDARGCGDPGAGGCGLLVCVQAN